MSKFDYAEFNTDCGYDRELVFNAKKYTPEQAIEIFCIEYEHLINSGAIRKPQLLDICEKTARYYVKAPFECFREEGGVYSFCSCGQRGSFKVITIDIDSLKI